MKQTINAMFKRMIALIASFSCFSNDEELNLKANFVISNEEEFRSIPSLIMDFLKNN